MPRVEEFLSILLKRKAKLSINSRHFGLLRTLDHFVTLVSHMAQTLVSDMALRTKFSQLTLEYILPWTGWQ